MLFDKEDVKIQGRVFYVGQVKVSQICFSDFIFSRDKSLNTHNLNAKKA